MPTILVVDDDVFNLEILSEHLEDAGYEPVTVTNGVEAWALLEESPARFDAVLLDRMMPEMDGIEVLGRIKQHPDLKTIPVIMQTAKASKHDILEGLQAGAYYYLTKPFERAQLLAIVQTAVNDHQRLDSLQTEVTQTNKTLSMMHKGVFSFRTLKESRDLVSLLANTSPEATRVAIGLSELMINAVEHGNLGITYEEKSRFNEHDNWASEVERRLSLLENAEKDVTLSFERDDKELRFIIRDQGSGFDWRQYLEISPERAFDSHGRGIAMAKAISFDQLEYRGKGNEVEAKVFLQEVDRAQG